MIAVIITIIIVTVFAIANAIAILTAELSLSWWVPLPVASVMGMVTRFQCLYDNILVSVVPKDNEVMEVKVVV